MKKLYLLTLVFLVMLCSVDAQVIYVKAGSNGNGSSWDKAYGDLQVALSVARFGNEIWVASGTYRPTHTSDRMASFSIPDGVTLYGGFKGYERSPGERDLANNPSILSGEIGNTATREDNSFSVVYTKNVSSATVVDGFVIQGGYANGTGQRGDIQRCGAGWFNDGSYGNSSPVIRNCTFTNNKGRDGAALYNYAHNGTVSPVIINCHFISNEADLDGGAIFNDGSMGQCSPVIEASLFENNRATYGAGIMNQGEAGETRPEIRRCQFLGNVSYIRGSSVYSNRPDNGICMPVIQGCLFEENQASVGREVSGTINTNTTAVKETAKSSVVVKAGY